MNKELEQLVSEVNRLQNLIAEYPPLEASEALQKVSFQQFVLGSENAIKLGEVVPEKSEFKLKTLAELL